MEGVQASSQRSLDRLKALDSLPDLSTQLAEANRLCTRSARADMIAKWLLQRIKASEEIRRNREAWKSLRSTVRLVSPANLATLLSSNDFFGTLISALEENNPSGILLEELSSIINLLLDVSETPNGASVKALLSLAGGKAASFLGLWLGGIRQGLAQGTNVLSLDSVSSLLSPAVKIWNLRKPSTEDNELFARHCLVPAACLLSTLTSTTEVITAKRKRDDESRTPRSECTKMLEVLLTKHVFLPARTAFHETQIPATDKTRRKVGFQNPMFAIESVLQPLKDAIAQRDEWNETYFAALPQLLDISLRSVSTNTPRQRLKERPWVEAVFETLLSCNLSSTGAILDRDALTQMLKVVGGRGTLSRPLLEKLVRSYSILAGPLDERDESEIHHREEWELMAQIIALDADIFADVALAGPLFTSVTRDDINIGGAGETQDRSITRLEIEDHSTAYKQTLWVDRIIIPIMKAFARNRNLLEFVDLWSQQLKQRRIPDLTLWAKLDCHFARLLEDSFDGKQITELFDRFSRTVMDSEPEYLDDGPESSTNIEHAVVILNGTLHGIQTESLVDEIGMRSEPLLTRLIDLYNRPERTIFTTNFPQLNSSRMWSLMTRAFQLWFPAWIAGTQSPDELKERCSWLISCNALKRALKYAKMTRSNNDCSVLAIQEASSAEHFVSVVCHSVSGFKETLEPEVQIELAETVKNLYGMLKLEASESILTIPSSFSSAHKTRIGTEFLRNAIIKEATSSNSGDIANSNKTALKALVTTAAEQSHVEVFEDLVRVAVDLLGDEDSPNKEEIAIDVLLWIPLTSLNRAQREKILDAVSTLSDLHIPNGRKQERRFAVLLKMMEVPNATSKLSTDHSMIWRVSLGLSASEYMSNDGANPPQVKDLKTIAMVQELVSLVVKHLLATQEQERSSAILLDLSRDVDRVLRILGTKKNIADHAMALAVSTSFMKEFEAGCREHLKRDCAHRDPNINVIWMHEISWHASRRFASMASENSSDSNDSGSDPKLNVALDALAVGMDVLLATSIGESAEVICGAIEDKLSAIVSEANGDDRLMKRLTPAKSELVRYFEVACKFVRADIDWRRSRIEVASFLLDVECSPELNQSVVAAVDDFINRLPAHSRISLIKYLLRNEGTVQRSTLLLLQVAVAKLHKDLRASDLGSSPDLLFSSLLRTIVESDDILTRQRATSCLTTALKSKPFLVNQHIVERILSTLLQLSNRRATDYLAFYDICQILSALLLTHRARLQGRFHLVNQIYQALISWLFRNASTQPSSDASPLRASPKHARALARVITLFCEPLLLRRQPNATTLIDESRKEQAHVGQFIHSVLHRYCSQLLNGSLGEGMKEALTPGLWSMIDAIEINDAEGMKSLSAAMNNSERAMLRGVYDEWKMFGKWRGG